MASLWGVCWCEWVCGSSPRMPASTSDEYQQRLFAHPYSPEFNESMILEVMQSISYGHQPFQNL
eukprot:1120698-Amphidinium_carterae.1